MVKRLLLLLASFAAALHYHLLGVPYAELNENFSSCAFATKTIRWCRMLNARNASYTVYANSGSDAVCRNVVELFSSAARQSHYGSDDLIRAGASFDQRTDSPGALQWIRLASAAIARRRTGSDLLLAAFGSMHAPIAAAIGLPAVEVGVGYIQTFSRTRIFESHTWLSQIKHQQGSPFSEGDAVVPMCYFADELQAPARRSDARYLAFVGRVTENKGIYVALSMLQRLPDFRLLIAGQGDAHTVLSAYPDCADRVEYLGVLPAQQKNALLAGAVALIAPTLYNEPFGSVMVEAQLLGTPVITTDHAGMSSTVWHGVTGFRCRSLRCFLSAAQQAARLDRHQIAEIAARAFLCDNVQTRYWDVIDGVAIPGQDCRNGLCSTGSAIN